MDDMILRQAAIDEIKAVYEWHDTVTVDRLIQHFKALPTVDAVPVVHGHWIYHPEWVADGECGYECSECGMGSDVDYQFCMRCGADMRKDGDNG